MADDPFHLITKVNVETGMAFDKDGNYLLMLTQEGINQLVDLHAGPVLPTVQSGHDGSSHRV